MTIENLIELSLLLFISALVVTISVQHIRNNALQEDIKDYQQQIDELHAASIKANDLAIEARIMADKTMKSANNKSKQIMKQKVPNDCEKSILWAANEAHKL